MGETTTGDMYRAAMINKLVTWDWSKAHWNYFTSFFDDAITILSDDESGTLIQEFNARHEMFQQKYGLTLSQAEIKLFMRISGASWKRLVRNEQPRYGTYHRTYVQRSLQERQINWLDIMEDLRLMRIWVQNQVKNIADQLAIGI